MAVYHSCTDLAFLFLVALLMILEALQVTALLRKDEIVLEGQQNLGALITCKIFIKTDDLFLKTAAGRLEIPLGCIDCGSLGGFSTLGSRFSTIDAPGISGLQIVTLMIIALDRPCDCALLLLESFGLLSESSLQFPSPSSILIRCHLSLLARLSKSSICPEL